MEKIFTSELKSKADAICARYDERRAAILEVMRLLQETYGHITLEIEAAVAEYFAIPAIDVRELVTFYTLFYDKPTAKTRFQVCRTLSCALRGGDEILKYFEERLGVRPGQITSDGKFSFHPVECLGACEMAPMMQMNDVEYVGPLTKEKIEETLKNVGAGLPRPA